MSADRQVIAMTGSDGLDFLLVAGLTAGVVFVAAAVVLWLMGKARRRHTAEPMPPDAGRAQLGD